MTCIHFWLTDSTGFGRCKHCGETKQFKGYEVVKLKPGSSLSRVGSATSSITREDFAIHPDFCMKSYVKVT